MKLSISNIIWTKGESHFEDFIKTASNLGFSAVEIALNCIWEEPTKISNSKIIWINSLLQDHNLKISALHSITYTKPTLTFFESNSKTLMTIDYIKKYIDIAEQLKTKNIVFGSPSTRKMFGKSKKECDEIFMKSFETIGHYSNNRVYINIEPLNIEMCEYLNTLGDVENVLNHIKAPSLAIQLDIRNCIENKETITDYNKVKKNIQHCQVGNPGLNFPGGIHTKSHVEFANALKTNNYSGYVAGEILNHDGLSPAIAMGEAFTAIKNIYV